MAGIQLLPWNEEAKADPDAKSPKQMERSQTFHGQTTKVRNLPAKDLSKTTQTQNPQSPERNSKSQGAMELGVVAQVPK